MRARWLVGGCAVAAALLVLPVSAQAEPELSESELRSRVDTLTRKAEVFTEKYNGKRLELKQARRAARRAEARAERVSQRLQRSRSLVGDMAASQYKSGGMGRSVSLLTSDDPQALLRRATMLEHLSRQKTARLQDLTLAVHQAQQAKQEATRAAGKVQTITADLEDKKGHIKNLIAEAQDKIAELEAQTTQPVGGADPAPAPVDVGEVGSGVAAQAVEIALGQQGDPYVWGAAGPDAFDCSGLAVYAFGNAGVSVPHYTGALWDNYPHVSYGAMQPGDIVFTSSHHMGIYIGNGQMVHAPNSGEVVRVDEVYEFYGAVRIV